LSPIRIAAHPGPTYSKTATSYDALALADNHLHVQKWHALIEALLHNFRLDLGDHIVHNPSVHCCCCHSCKANAGSPDRQKTACEMYRLFQYHVMIFAKRCAFLKLFSTAQEPTSGLVVEWC
jgi:hypothetical protein